MCSAVFVKWRPMSRLSELRPCKTRKVYDEVDMNKRGKVSITEERDQNKTGQIKNSAAKSRGYDFDRFSNLGAVYAHFAIREQIERKKSIKTLGRAKIH